MDIPDKPDRVTESVERLSQLLDPGFPENGWAQVRVGDVRTVLEALTTRSQPGEDAVERNNVLAGEVLAGGMTLDAISASNMRHVVSQIAPKARAAITAMRALEPRASSDGDVERTNCPDERRLERYGDPHAGIIAEALQPPSNEARLREALEWQSIDTAPKDGSDVLLFVRDTEEQFVGYWSDGAWIYALCRGTQVVCKPDMWRSLVAPPTPLPDTAQESVCERHFTPFISPGICPFCDEEHRFSNEGNG